MKDFIKNKNIKKYLPIIFGIILIIVVAVIVIIIIINDKDDNVINNFGVDPNNATYQGKEIKTDKYGNTIIEEENDSKTIQTVTIPSTSILATKDIQKKYNIAGLNVSKKGASTIVSGTIKNNKSKYHTVYITAKFMMDKEIVGTATTKVDELKKGKTKNFEIAILGDLKKYDYTVEVEYVD